MFNVPTVLLQWSAGGLLFLWVTTRRREAGLGYGWISRTVFCLLAVGAAATSSGSNVPGAILAGSVAVAVTSAFALAVSIAHKSAGVSGQREQSYQRSERVAQMTGIEREVTFFSGREFPPVLDLFAPVLGLAALLVAGMVAIDGSPLLAFRLLTGALLMGAATDAMLLGHWYLVQPGLARDALKEMVNWLIVLTPIEVIAYLIPIGMISAINGTISDGYSGILTYFWIGCAVGTVGLALVAKAALKERQYSAVMAATGLTYLSILTAFGVDLVARAILA